MSALLSRLWPHKTGIGRRKLVSKLVRLAAIQLEAGVSSSIIETRAEKQRNVGRQLFTAARAQKRFAAPTAMPGSSHALVTGVHLSNQGVFLVLCTKNPMPNWSPETSRVAAKSKHTRRGCSRGRSLHRSSTRREPDQEPPSVQLTRQCNGKAYSAVFPFSFFFSFFSPLPLLFFPCARFARN